jgi:hypothetical protein
MAVSFPSAYGLTSFGPTFSYREDYRERDLVIAGGIITWECGLNKSGIGTSVTYNQSVSYLNKHRKYWDAGISAYFINYIKITDKLTIGNSVGGTGKLMAHYYWYKGSFIVWPYPEDTPDTLFDKPRYIEEYLGSGDIFYRITPSVQFGRWYLLPHISINLDISKMINYPEKMGLFYWRCDSWNKTERREQLSYIYKNDLLTVRNIRFPYLLI